MLLRTYAVSVVANYAMTKGQGTDDTVADYFLVSFGSAASIMLNWERSNESSDYFKFDERKDFADSDLIQQRLLARVCA